MILDKICYRFIIKIKLIYKTIKIKRVILIILISINMIIIIDKNY